MVSQQGSLELLNHPVAKEMLQAPIPARLAYVWTDGSPRVVPIGFHWDGKQIVMAGAHDQPKVKALQQNPKVALTIDSQTMPYHVLMIRGTAEVTFVDGMVPEYALMSERNMGKEAAQAWLAQVSVMTPRWGRIAVTLEWVGILDFQERLPHRIEEAIARMQAHSG